MLKEFIFVIKEKTLQNRKVMASIEETIRYMKEEGYESSCTTETSILGAEASGRDICSDLGKTLFITDSGRAAAKLHRDGCYCVGFVHEDNGSENFEGLKYIFSEVDQVDADSFVKVYQRYAGEPWEVITTDRLLIRETTIEDVDVFYELYKEPEMTRYMEGLFENPEDEKRYQRDYIEKVYGLMGFGVWTIVRREDNRIIGRAGYSVRNGFEEIELGFLIGKEFQRKGYAYEACSAILEYGRSVLGFETVQTLVKKENVISLNLCAKLGFVRDEEVDVEENIYGEGYETGKKANHQKARFGKYVRFIKHF